MSGTAQPNGVEQLDVRKVSRKQPEFHENVIIIRRDT